MKKICPRLHGRTCWLKRQTTHSHWHIHSYRVKQTLTGCYLGTRRKGVALQLHYTRSKDPHTHLTRGWLVLRVDLDGAPKKEIPCPYWSLYGLSYLSSHSKSNSGYSEYVTEFICHVIWASRALRGPFAIYLSRRIQLQGFIIQFSLFIRVDSSEIDIKMMIII